MTTVGVLHPGEMGAAVAAGLVAGGAKVLWAGDGRSPATRGRAEAAGLVDVGDLAALAAQAEIVVSVCPPDAAVELAEQVAAVGFAGLYLDANAVAPSTARLVEERVTVAGGTFLDGAVIGGPDAPRLFLSGGGAADAVALFGAPVDAVAMEEEPYAASALKMMYAGWSKGTTALLFTLAAASRRLGVEEALRAEWERSQAAVLRRLDGTTASAAKAWRWTGEMDEIARTLEEAGLPGGFHAGAADLYGRLAPLKDDRGASLDDIIRLALAPDS